MKIGTFLIILWNAVAVASSAPALLLNDFVQDALKFDIEYQGAIVDYKMAQIKKDVSGSLWRNALEISPYALEYKVSNIPNLSGQSFQEQGVQWGLSQFTPWGTQMRLGYDQIFENNRTGTLAKDQGLAFSLTQPLWKNQFGQTLRREQSQLFHQANASSLTAQLKQRAACLRAANAYVDAWTRAEIHRFVGDVFQMSEDLFAKGAISVKRGQISQLDWLSVQADHINLQTAKSHSEQELASALVNLEKLSPTAPGKSVSNPESDFLKVLNSIQSMRAPVETLNERTKKEILSGLEEQLASERSNALPDLDLKLSQKWNQGKMEAERYRDNEFAASLNLVWKFNDLSVGAPVSLSQLQARKAALQLEESLRLRQPNFQERKTNLASLEKQIKLEENRSNLLGRITEENKKRFLQGRIEFQDLLRIKEQWFESEQKRIEKRSYFWKSLLEFAFQQEVNVNFCGGEV